MKKLYDFVCSACQHTFEELIDADESAPSCIECGQPTNRLALSFNPTHGQDPHWAEILMKGRNMRNKYLGKVPWRKSSWSQTD